MKRLGIALFILASLGTALAQLPPQYVQPRDTVTVSADGKFEAEPDTAIIQFNIAAQENDLRAANERASKAAEQVRQTLRANGIDPKQAQIGFFQVSPVYDWRNPKRKLVAYRVSSTISLKLKDFSKVGPLAGSFAEMDVTEGQSIRYELDDIEQAKNKAVQDAVRHAYSNATAVAQAGKRALGDLVRANVDVYPTPIPMPMAMEKSMRTISADAAAPATQEFSPEKITITARVTAEYSLK